MKAIIIAEHEETGLYPLTERIPHPLLPIAGKTILMHALEMLHRASFREVQVVSPSRHRQLAEATDTGPLLGMSVEFLPGVENLEKSVKHCLVVGLTHILDTDWEEELGDLGDLKVHALMPIRMTVKGNTVGVLLPPKPSSSIPGNWNEIKDTKAINLPIGPKRVLSTASITEFHKSTFTLLRGEFRYLKPAGRNFAPGHTASPQARIKSRLLNSEFGYFGSNCRVDKSAGLSGHVAVGSRSVIEKGAQLRDSIIMDGTYIGPNTDFSHAIVERNTLIRVDTGVCLKLDDPVLFGATA